MCISQNNLYKQHHTLDYLQKPVTYSKSLVHLSKVSIYVNEHISAQWKVLVSLFTNKIVKMLSHVVNITVHSVSRLLPAVKYGNSLDDSYCTEMQKASFLTYAIYPFQKYKFTHYCFETFELQ